MTAPALFTKHQGLAVTIASDWRIPGMDHEDVRQEARVSLWIACRKYNPELGTFTAFAGVVIRRRMRDLLQAATREKRTCQLELFKDPPTPELERTIIGREELREALSSPRLEQRRRWREAKRRQKAA